MAARGAGNPGGLSDGPESSMKKILIVNPFGIGDVLFSTPLIAALKERLPEASVSYIGNARTAPFLQNDSRLLKVFAYERDEFLAVYRASPWRFLLKWKRFVRMIRAERFDTVFDLSLGSPVSLALLLAGIPRRVGYDFKGRGRWLTDKVPLKRYEGRHVAEYYLDLLDIVGLARETALKPPVRMTLHVAADDESWAGRFMAENGLQERAYVVVYPGGGASWGAGADLKRWPAERYAHLVEKIIERSKCPIILMGDRSEEKLCRVVAGGSRGVIFLAGQTSLAQAAALMRGASCVVVNDGGPLHVAAASGCRTVSLFGPVDPVVYGPFPADADHRIVTRGLPCQPCYRDFRMSSCAHRRCLSTLTVDEVLNVAEEFLT
jgi:lipopolysaccharide heptosyltransferase II